MLSRLPAGLCAAALAALIGAPTPTLAQDKTFELKLSHWVPPSHPLQKALEEWGASVEKDSGGTIKYKVYPAQQLGKAFDHYDMARDGIADLTYINPGYQPGRFPIIGAGELPFLVANAKGGSQALDAWYRTGSPAALASYSETCLRRVWRAQHFSYWMTTMLHRFPEDDAFQRKLQLAQLRWVSSSRDAAASLAENYVGIAKV